MAIDSNAITLAAPKQRYEIADYLKVGGTYYLMGAGFTSINESYGAQEDSKVYVNDKETTTWLKSFQREFSYNNDLIFSEKAIAALREVGERGLTGTQAMFEYVRVDLFRPKSNDDSNSEFYARHWIVSCVPDSEEGEGADTITNTGTLKTVGNMDEGWFNVTENTFTKDASAAATAAAVDESASSGTTGAETTQSSDG